MGRRVQLLVPSLEWLRNQHTAWWDHLQRGLYCNPLVLVFAALAAGILLDEKLLPRWSPVWFLCAILVCVVATAMRVAMATWPSANFKKWLAVIIAFAAGGFARHHAYWHWYRANEIGYLIGEERRTAIVRGVLTSEPRWLAPSEGGSLAGQRSPGILMHVRVRAWQKDGNESGPFVAASGNLALFTSGAWLPLRAGDLIQVKGRIARIETQRNPREFDFANYFRGQRRLANMNANTTNDIKVVGREFTFWSWLRSMLRAELDRQIARYVDHPRADLASAILLGNREQLSNDERDLFLHTGTVHLLAISGLHIGILSGALYVFLRVGLLSRRVCLWCVIGLVLVYAWLVEFRPPVTRAAILIVLFSVARLRGIPGFSYNLLCLSAIIVLVINPRDLFHVGPQFSFLAVAVLIHLSQSGWLKVRQDPLDHLVYVTRSGPVRAWLRCWRRIKQAFLSCGVLWLMTLPLVADRYAVVAPIGLLVNPLVLIPMALALYGGLIVMLTATWCPAFVVSFGGWLCNANLAVIEGIIGWGAKIPGSHFWTAGPEGWGVIIFYGTLLVWLALPRWARDWRIAGVGIALWLVASWWLPARQSEWRRRSADDLQITVADVGHGTGTVVRLPGGKVLMYDAGSFGSTQRGGRAMSANLWAERINRIDVLVISHADADHYNAIPTLLVRFHVGRIFVNKQMLASDSPSVAVLLDEIRRRRVPLSVLSAGDRIDLDSRVAIEVLSPPAEGFPGNDNVNSIVLRVRAYERSVILPGDLEGPGLTALLEKPHEPYHVVMAPHHGSMSSHPDKVADWAKPKLVIISGARSRINPQCVKAYEDKGAKVLTTGSGGAIRLRISPAGIEWQTWLREGKPQRKRRFSDLEFQTLQ